MPRFLFVKTRETDTAEEQRAFASVADGGGHSRFVLKDVCDVLALDQPHRVIERVEKDDRNSSTVIDRLGRSQQVSTVNESGLYDVIFQSRKPEAKRFRRWVTNEVLPAIRKTGASG